MPEFTTVIWDCGTCGWSSEPDGFVGVADSDELATAGRAWGQVEPQDPPDDAVAALTEHEGHPEQGLPQDACEQPDPGPALGDPPPALRSGGLSRNTTPWDGMGRPRTGVSREDN
jgi:hypothetical protein